ncbi:response regulator receiver modulated diguanylate cyclase [Aliiroseovarius sediminilitoris]|uniref:diguanylate cyclase n=1 Tax=Aliiroseovarius sediminilitoris TaxID=1173584 RepID=A0A1I0P9I1_9RHOB|nr:diguanylate cyclase [Aliiroseovarius sediminilitoris]SEW10883.1 response regulator receiver modulated diguanylate cyclase [Aliiroseovarius sediminilitoris]
MSERILIADDLATNRIVLKVKLTVACYEVIQTDRCDEVAALARDVQPDLIILGRGRTECSLSTCRALKADPTLGAIPIIMVSDQDDQRARLEAIMAGADDVFSKPLNEATLMAMVRNLIRARGADSEVMRRRELSRDFGCAEAPALFARHARVALIAPDAETGIYWRMHLATEIRHRIDIMTQSQALEDVGATGNVPDAFVIASTLNETSDGLRLVSELRSRQTTRHSVIVVQDCGETPSPSSMALDLGANAVLRPGFDARELSLRLTRLLARKFEGDDLRKNFDTNLALALRDPLTGLHNRRFAQSYLDRLEREAQLKDQPYAIMVLDLDRFKSINDRFGHPVGDDVLVEVSKRLKTNLRDMDLLARYGGEEFLIALPGVTRRQAQTMAERLRHAVGDRPIASGGVPKGIDVTLSIGVAVSSDAPRSASSAHELLQFADQALYRAKSDGRNQVTFVSDAA